MFDEMIEITSSADNLLKLLKCYERIDNEDFLLMLHNIIQMELNVLYIDTYKVCMPIIKKHNDELNKSNVVQLTSKLKVEDEQ